MKPCSRCGGQNNLVVICEECLSGYPVAQALFASGADASRYVPKARQSMGSGRGLTQSAFAAELGVSRGTVARWEAKKAKPSKLARNKIQELLELTAKVGEDEEWV
jgi:DNA-binding XRE family transcriptional regulator